MDHDKQVKDLVQLTRDRFLDQPIARDDQERESFDLEKEFAKASKNRSVFIPLAVVGFLVVLALGAWLASQFTEQASQKSSVTIGSFEDLKLKEIFDTARRNKADLEMIQDQMNQLTVASAAKVASLQQAGTSRADIASVNDPSGNQAKAILAETAKLVAAERAALAQALRPLRAQADEVQKKIDSYDDRIGQLNKKNQQVLDTQQRVFDIEKNRLVEQYETRIRTLTAEKAANEARLKKERDDLVTALRIKQADDIRKLILKYNPLAGDSGVQDLINELGSRTAAYPGLILPDRIASREVLSVELQQTLEARVGRTQTLLNWLREIPFENAVPPVLNALDNAIADSLAGYDGYLAPLAAHMTSLDAVIAAREAEINNLQADLASERMDRMATEAAMNAERLALEEASAAERQRLTSWLGRWTGGVDDFVLTLRDHDGLIVDVRVPDDVLIVLKPDRASSLRAALTLAVESPVAVVPGRAVPPPVNLATIRDGLNNGELGQVTVEPAGDGTWRAKLVKLNDPKRPFKAYDRLILALPNKK